jgi:hypothetical protein
VCQCGEPSRACRENVRGREREREREAERETCVPMWGEVTAYNEKRYRNTDYS